MAEGLRVASPYLDTLEAQRRELVAALAPVVSADDVAGAQQRSAMLSVRLDASPLQDETADAVDRGELLLPVVDPTDGSGAGWATALRLDGMPTQEIAAVEYRGVRAALADEAALAAGFFAAPTATLTRVQRRIAAGLVADDRLGALRTTSRALHDGAQGRVIFHAPPPRELPALLAELDAWLRGARDRHSPLAIAGVVHARLLQWRPFEAGNGRVARAASRLALRASGGDPWGLAVPEHAYLRERMAYVTEIAATIRRRTDLRPWNERTGEAVVASLEEAARGHGLVPQDLVARAVHVCEALDVDEAITAPALAVDAGLDRPIAIAQLNRLCWAGLLRRDAGTHGLRYVRLGREVSYRSGSIAPF